jgi:hypothetical protein
MVLISAHDLGFFMIFINGLTRRRTYEENNTITICPRRHSNYTRVLYVLDKSKTALKHNIINHGSLRTYGRIYFFIQQYIIHREEVQKKRQNHFEILKTRVLEAWVKEIVCLSKMRDGCNPSFIDVYVNIVDKLQSNIRFQQVRSHLEHDVYKEGKALLDKIVERSTNHNKNVSTFMGSVKRIIINNVFAKDISSGEISTFTDYKDPKQNRGYAMSNIHEHYYNEAIGNHANLLIDKEPGETRYKLHREHEFNPMVISTTQHGLEIIRERLEGEKLKIEITDKLDGLLKEAREICDLYNNEFLLEIRNIIAEIEDEGILKGGCGLTYCYFCEECSFSLHLSH